MIMSFFGTIKLKITPAGRERQDSRGQSDRRDRQADRSAAAQDPGTEGPDAGKVLRTAGRKLRILGPDRAGRTAHQPDRKSVV